MIDLYKAQITFQQYVSHFDKTLPPIQSKIIHTYKVVEIMKYLTSLLHLNEEDTALALLIALLHDLGRFEQYTRYRSFVDHETIDHADFSTHLLFEEGLINEFTEDRQYDKIIRQSIEQHNKYQITVNDDEYTLMFIHLIRDADKLDIFRVKNEKSPDLFKSMEKDTISLPVYEQFLQEQTIYNPLKKTSLDTWIAAIALVFDLHYKESLFYIKEHQITDQLFNHVQPADPLTALQYQKLRKCMKNFLKRN